MALGHPPGAGPALSYKQCLVAERIDRCTTAAQLQLAGRCDSDDLVLEERLSAHPVRELNLTRQPEMDLASRDALRHPAAGADHDVDVDRRVTVGEALQDRRQDVAARSRRSRQRQGSALGGVEGAQILLHRLERVEHAQSVYRYDLTSLGQPT